MTIREKIVADLTAAMKSRDAVRLGVLRMLKARIMEAEVGQRAQGAAAGSAIDDAGALVVIAAYAKQRKDSIAAYRQGGREDLASKEEAELAITQEFLPAQLSAEDVRKIVSEAIAASGASSLKDMGAVMKLVLPRLKGVSDGKMVNDIVREMLASG